MKFSVKMDMLGADETSWKRPPNSKAVPIKVRHGLDTERSTGAPKTWKDPIRLADPIRLPMGTVEILDGES